MINYVQHEGCGISLYRGYPAPYPIFAIVVFREEKGKMFRNSYQWHSCNERLYCDGLFIGLAKRNGYTFIIYKNAKDVQNN